MGYRVFTGFRCDREIEFDWFSVLIGFSSGSHRVFTGLYRAGTGFRRWLPGFTGFFFQLIYLYAVETYCKWFRRLLLGFTGFYWVVTGFRRLRRWLPGFTGFSFICTAVEALLTYFKWFYRVLPGFTGFYWVFVDSKQVFYLVLPGLTGLSLISIGCTIILPSFSWFHRFYWVFTGFSLMLTRFSVVL